MAIRKPNKGNWADGDIQYRGEPSGAKKLVGWIKKERPSFRWFNWLTWHVYETLSWIYDFQTDFYLVGTNGDYADINSAIADGVTRIALCSDIVVDAEQDISLADVILKTNGYSIISDTDAIAGAILKISGQNFSAHGLIKILSANTTGNTTNGISVTASDALFRARIIQSGVGTLDEGLTVDTACEGCKIYAHFVEQGGVITTKLNDLSISYTNIIEYIDIYSGAKVPDEIMYNVSKEITGTDIDWSLSRVWNKTISVDTTFTFSNTNKNNSKIIVSITDANNKDNIWPTYVKWDNDASAPSQTPLKTDVYEFRNIGGNIIGKKIYVNMTGSWPYGILGDLTIANGVTVDLPANAIYDYNNVTIDAGGKLRFTGNTTGFAILGVKGNLVLNGTIECKDSTATGSVSGTAPDGVALSSTIAQKNGGAGGAGGTSSGGSSYGAGGAGGAQNNGNGGGGGGGGAGGTSTVKANGGAGGSGGNGSNGGSYNNGVGGTRGTGGVSPVTNGYIGDADDWGATGGNGGNGASGGGGGGGVWTVQNSQAGGGGGGGGQKGLHGKNIYIHVTGNITGSGSIDVSGTNGVNGKNGGNGDHDNGVGSYAGAGGGGGGGGGAGGSAGKIYIRYHGTYATPLTYVLTGGTGGTKGTKGTSDKNFNAPSDGSNGTAGDNGSTDVASI